MKIIFANRKECLTSRGGDTVQMLKTKEYLEKDKNITVNICLTPEEILKDKEAKIVHIFNIQTIEETNKFIEACKNSGKKVVLSTIYWDLSHSMFVIKMFKLFKSLKVANSLACFKDFVIKLSTFREYIDNNPNNNWYLTNNYINQRRYALMESDVILPNSDEEFEILCKEFQINQEELRKKTVIVPNAIDMGKKKNDTSELSDNDEDFKGLKDFVLEVGRIEVNKNQLGVVSALMDEPQIPIVFVGRVSDNAVDKEYYEKLRELSEKRGNVHFISEIPQDKVFEYYKKAKVHVLPSFRESPGLSTLEAFYFGCEIVTSSKEYCPVEYYNFVEKAHICDPYDPSSIKKAILAAFSNPKNSGNENEYFEKYSYKKVAEIMSEVYEKLMNE